MYYDPSGNSVILIGLIIGAIIGLDVTISLSALCALVGSILLMAYDGSWTGDDPTKAQEGFEWRGKGQIGSREGNWYNPKTGEILHPDLDHPEPIGPHCDFRDIFEKWRRIFKNGGKIPKI